MSRLKIFALSDKMTKKCKSWVRSAKVTLPQKGTQVQMVMGGRTVGTELESEFELFIISKYGNIQLRNKNSLPAFGLDRSLQKHYVFMTLKLNFPMLCVLLFTCWLCPLIIMINCKQRVESWEFFLNKANPEPFKITFCSTLTNVSASTGALTLDDTLGWIFSAIDHL